MENIQTRLHIIAKGKHYYDIGLRKGNNILSNTTYQFGDKCPRYLEDFVRAFGKSKIKILGYGILLNEKEYIQSLLD